MLQRIPNWVSAVFTCAVIANLIAFAVVCGRYGWALGGKVEAGRYFLNNHGLYTRVSQQVFVLDAAWSYASLLGLLSLYALAKAHRRSGSGTSL
ncbi:MULTISPECIES: hypothetical protein [unclassified Caulobacter]|uniref:hypothetical protein n=1 Tax=unclassified Caulobacter TaxID=2648921 RepID=UPI0011B84DFD|nr:MULTISPECIES: hypothetical protein [unclassified Caulobacter]